MQRKGTPCVFYRIRKFLKKTSALFILGKSDLKEESRDILMENEELIATTEIVYYSEMFYALIFVVLIANLGVIFFLIWTGNLIFIIIPLIVILFSILMLYYATEVQKIFLTNERLVINHLSLFEKILRVPRNESILLDQIAIIKYSRAPFNKGALTSGTIILISSLILQLLLFQRISTHIFLLILSISFESLLIAFSIYLFTFGARLTKRALELYVIGITRPIVIGQFKGIPLWFVNELHKAVLERVHHTFHASKEILQLYEFPLESSSTLKTILENENKELHRKILFLLDKKNLDFDEIAKNLPDCTEERIRETLNELVDEELVEFNDTTKKWAVKWKK